MSHFLWFTVYIGSITR